MMLDVRICPQRAMDYNLINLDTNRIISNAIWADDDTGEYGIMDSYFFGGCLFKKSENIIVKKGNIKLIKNVGIK